MACGLVILGGEAGCGKTVFMTGLAAALREQGFPTRAIKPFLIATRRDAEAELSFISSITHTPLNYPMLIIDQPITVLEGHWQHAVMMCASRQHLTLVEMPGSCATPVSFEQTAAGTVAPAWKDSADFANDLALPCIVVARHNHEALEKLVLNITYLASRSVRVIGAASVATAEYAKGQELKLSSAEIELALMGRTKTPYLGLIQYSPSISVPRVNQGNLIKMTSQGIDLLQILRSLNAPVSMGSN